jgi:AbrB family looped-hinge helix DNA binding protein
MQKTLGATKVSVKGQVTIPADARKLLKIVEGDRVLFIEKDGEIVIKKG